MTHGSNALAFRSHRIAFFAAAMPALSLPFASKSIARRAHLSRSRLYLTCCSKRSMRSTFLAIPHYAAEPK